MKPRFTISLSKNNVIELYINEIARDILIQQLTGLNKTSDHVHLSANWPAEIELSEKKYTSSDTVFTEAKILLRPDEWDKEYYPHVLENT